MIYLCIYSPVCSVWNGLVFSLFPGVPVCVYLALSCPALFGLIKDYYFQFTPRLRVPVSSSCVHRDNNLYEYEYIYVNTCKYFQNVYCMCVFIYV